MIPFADFFNHSCDPEQYYTSYVFDGGNFVFKADKDIPPGTQVPIITLDLFTAFFIGISPSHP